MKKLTYIFLTICFCSTLHAQETGTIYFMRKTGISGTVSAFNAFIDGEPISVMVEPGQPTFVQMVLEARAIINNLYCLEITESSARPILRKLKEDTKCR